MKLRKIKNKRKSYKKEISKKPTQKQYKAIKRNHNKMRLCGFSLDTSSLTKEEQVIWGKAKTYINELIFQWDENSRKLGMNVKSKDKFHEEKDRT